MRVCCSCDGPVSQAHCHWSRWRMHSPRNKWGLQQPLESLLQPMQTLLHACSHNFKSVPTI